VPSGCPYVQDYLQEFIGTEREIPLYRAIASAGSAGFFFPPSGAAHGPARGILGSGVKGDLDLTTFPRAMHAWDMAMPEVSETDDFAIIVFREDERWDADVLPVAVTADLEGLIRALRQQPSIAGTIGMAGIDDYFFVAVRVIGSQVSVLLSDIGAALDYPLAEQVLDYLDIPVPDEDELDQVLPVGDLSIFADLGLDEMELAAICSRLDLDMDEDADHVDDAMESIATRLGFGPAVERALDLALGS
jgi:putative tRNA adenosine deaminase-associated protein